MSWSIGRRGAGWLMGHRGERVGLNPSAVDSGLHYRLPCSPMRTYTRHNSCMETRVPTDAVAQLNAVLETRYAIERELGRGGMATVYLARDLRHDRRVALKLLDPELGAVDG